MLAYDNATTVRVPGIDKTCELEQLCEVNGDSEMEAVFDISSTLSIGSEQVARVSGWIVLKDLYRYGGFHEEGDFVSQELCEFAVGLFSDTGKLKKKFYEHPIQKGSGVWGPELNSGGLVITFNWEVTDEYTRKGVGKWLLAKHMGMPPIRRHAESAYVHPCWTGMDAISQEQYRANSRRLVLGFRRLGYRRIGRTDFLCKPLNNPSHPALSLPINNDGERPEDHITNRAMNTFTNWQGDDSPQDYQCTCGECIDGFLSKRMLFRITVAGHVSGDTLRLEAQGTSEDQPVEMFMGEECVPPELYRPEGFSPKQARGLAAMHIAIGNLAERGVKPTLEAIEVEVSTVRDAEYVQSFKDIGGTAEISLNAILYRAWEEGPEGDDTFAMCYPETGSPKNDFRDLPNCDNDFKWGIVRQKLGTSYEPRTYQIHSDDDSEEEENLSEDDYSM